MERFDFSYSDEFESGVHLVPNSDETEQSVYPEEGTLSLPIARKYRKGPKKFKKYQKDDEL